MFQCAWCKNDTNVYEWSKDKDPLCSDCAPKYNFGLARGMINGKVSDLSKERRREISERMANYYGLRRALHSVGREELTGKAKNLASIVGWILFALWLWGMKILSALVFPDWFIFHGVAGGIFFFLAPLVVMPAFSLLLFLMYQGIVWCIKFWQLKES